MGRPLQDLLEMEFKLMYYLHIQDFAERDVSEIEWLYGRLIKQQRIEAGLEK